ncbi:hypothetical protein QLH52_13005 [Methylomonas sp. OY6]|uniref:Uncharacterized protein n=1 Tax=Methylomonas defluvii TaxID=3045149 RepID=A0ABU4UFP0_9GAMM|nr:hypothetical protein [Methylomonas sp. OY6]MDX8128208.1 hypothetical protein [Methylomonas sp. OY6]
MFERVVLKRSLDGPGISIGEIAEALLFYQSVHVVLDHSSLFGLIKNIGMRNVLKLLSLPDIRTTYIDEMTGTRTEQTSAGPEYSLVSFMLTGHQDIGVFPSRKKRLEAMLESNGYNKSDVKFFVEKFRKCVSYKKLGDDYFIKGGLISAARVDLFENAYVAEASKVVAQHLLGQHSLSSNFFFRVIPNGETFSVATNLDFDLISTIQQAKDKNAGQYTPAHITSELLNASMGVIFAGHYGGDFYTSETESKIIQLRQRYLLHRFQLDRSAISDFQEITLKGSPSIVEVINQKKRSFEEFLELLSSAKKFKNWLKGKSPDESLITGYLEDITAQGWLSSAPGKVLRYVVGSSVGAIEPISGLAISAGDSFFLDKLFSGWKPNQFIESKVRPFVDPDGDFD